VAARFQVRPGDSAVLIEARSNVGPIVLATTDLSGTALVDTSDDQFALTAAELRIPVTSLHSGRQLYDAEVHRRLDAQRYPLISADLRAARRLNGARWSLDGAVTIHGTVRPMTGAAELLLDGEHLRASGEHVVDIREFGISLPSALMLRIYPDVTVRFRLEASSVGDAGQE
jgi:polyisoprenoid-binding protein YceI